MGQTIRLRGAIRLALRLLPISATVICVAWLLTQSPFAAPMVERTSAQIEAELTRAMAREVDLAWLTPRMEDASANGDLIQIELLVDLAIEFQVEVPPDLKTQLQDVVDAKTGFLATARGCSTCAFDISTCETIGQIGACALPFELTPAGDVNALRRAGVAYVAGEDVDDLDVGLAIVGLGATGAVLATGGGSYTIKAGTSLLRLARRMGTLSAPLAARLSTLVGQAVRWDRMGDLAALRITPSAMVDATKLAEITDLGGSLRRVADNTSVAETMILLRHVDSAQDAAKLARVTDAVGPKARAAFQVLGKTRVFRALARLSDLAIGAALAIYTLALQLLVFGAQQYGNAGLRVARRTSRRASRNATS